MLTRFRRPIAAFMGTITMFTTVGTTYVEAMEVRKAEYERRMAVTETVEVFDNSGDRSIYRSEESGAMARAANFVKEARMSDPAIYDALISRISSVRSKFKQRAKREYGSLSIQLLRAWSEPTDSGYRAAMDALPVTVERTNVVDDLGRQAVRSEYSVKGVLKLRVIQVSPETRVTDRLEGAGEAYAADNALETMGGFSSPDPCYWYDPDLQDYVEDTCLTQQELDDASATIAALDYDVGVTNDAYEIDQAWWDDWCLNNYSYNECFPSAPEPARELGLGSLEGTPDGDDDGTTVDMIPPCLGEGVTVVFEWGAFAMARHIAIMAILSPEPATKSVTVPVGAAVIAGGLLLGGFISMMYCVEQLRQH